MEVTTESKPRTMQEDLAAATAEIAARASGQKEELPEGSDPIVPEVEAAAPVVEEPEEEIRIGDQVFKKQSEAIAYAQNLEAKNQANEAYAQGLRDSMAANAPAPVVQVEENFEEEFYKDPKGTLAKVQEQATDKAVARIQGEIQREKLWDQFLTKYPELERRDAERIMKEEWDTIGKITDLSKGMEVLANKTRAYYDSIVERYKPRSELPKTKAQAVSPSSGASSGVTPNKKSEIPLSFSEELRRSRKKA
jgi:hypothetical protein